ncbi:hypothetical protein M413DRAFT_217635 [Hebeloma cylindrosporum]|uniref:Uncharacterized protein n=1 Tax=Hebeloma cylindrosporum TaxID=76867 RepID=A0A0C3CVW2_HEBCY|nr:hypothetical protein M413DRAFT_217635 [Hebeloma cylindrosporum h7]
MPGNSHNGSVFTEMVTNNTCTRIPTVTHFDAPWRGRAFAHIWMGTVTNHKDISGSLSAATSLQSSAPHRRDNLRAGDLPYRSLADDHIFKSLQRELLASRSANLAAEVSSERRHSRIKTTPGSYSPKTLLDAIHPRAGREDFPSHKRGPIFQDGGLLSIWC